MEASLATATGPVLREIEGPDACGMCGRSGLKTEVVREPFVYGAGDAAVELVVDVPVHTCTACDLSYTGEAAARIEHDVVCRHLGLLTPGEIEEIHTGLGLSRAEVGELAGVGEAKLARWERGTVMQDRASDGVLRRLGGANRQNPRG